MLTPEQQMRSLEGAGVAHCWPRQRASLSAEEIDRGIVAHFREPVMVTPETAPVVVERLIRTTRAFCRVKDREWWREEK